MYINKAEIPGQQQSRDPRLHIENRAPRPIQNRYLKASYIEQRSQVYLEQRSKAYSERRSQAYVDLTLRPIERRAPRPIQNRDPGLAYIQ